MSNENPLRKAINSGKPRQVAELAKCLRDHVVEEDQRNPRDIDEIASQIRDAKEGIELAEAKFTSGKEFQYAEWVSLQSMHRHYQELEAELRVSRLLNSLKEGLEAFGGGA